MTREFLEQAAELAGWSVAITTPHNSNRNYYVCFSTDTTCGQDVESEFEVDDFDELPDLIYDTWFNYDVNEETRLWLGEDGHGKNGAPDNIEDILDDMKQVENSLERLYDALNGNLKEEEGVDFTRKARNLLEECLSALTSESHNAGKSKFVRDAKSYKIKDKCSKYIEITFVDGQWTLIDSDGLYYSVQVVPLEEFCEMVDAIINGKE